MNPLVSEMLLARNREDIELRNLEDLLNDDCKCESRHQGVISLICTKTVTHIAVMKCGGGTVKQCESAAISAIRVVKFGTHSCASCRENVADCWEIRPI